MLLLDEPVVADVVPGDFVAGGDDGAVLVAGGVTGPTANPVGTIGVSACALAKPVHRKTDVSAGTNSLLLTR